jgi:two-component system CheB/CheR fusion protein
VDEELRTVLEELEASREELQAVNEELSALDEENRRRIEALAQLSSDMQYLLESTGIATLFLDLDLKIVRFTPQLAELFSVRRTDVGRPLSDLAHGLAYDDLEADARRVIEHLTTVDREVSSTTGRWYLSRMVPYRRAGGGISGVVLTLVDITERKHAEEVLREADRRKDEFLAVLAHELRNPLAPITSGLEILKTASSDRVVAQVTATMSRQTLQLVRLVDDLLEVSRIRGGKLRLQRAPVKLEEIVRDAIAAVRPLMDSFGHDLAVSVPEEPIVIDGDATRLAQVLANLLNNAARYTPRGGRVALEVRSVGRIAVVSVTDNGVGITGEALDHVFDMFYQSYDRAGYQDAGMGIGLTLAKALVELHGGTISVHSAGAGCGSEFRVRLPISSEAVPVTARRASDSRNGGRRVLVVDDNADAAETLGMLLRTLGDHEVHTATSGRQALQKAEAIKPEVVLVDLMMPEMDGYEVARRMRRAPWGRQAFLVALSGWGQEEHMRRTYEAGFDRHLVKPADRATLEAVLDAPVNAEPA